MTISFNPNKIRPVSQNNISTSQKFMKSIAEGGLARFILLEACVEAGRTYQAYNRGGFYEARERITEEFSGAVFWLGGVKFFNSIIDKIGKRVLKLDNVDFDLGIDNARDPLNNYVNDQTKGKSKEAAEAFRKKLNKFKGIKAITSVLLANIMIGFVVPKINQAITRSYHKHNEDKKQISNEQSVQNEKLRNAKPPILPDIKTYLGVNDDKDLSFGKLGLIDVARNLETNTTWQLLSSDAGTVSGRVISARNNDERVEIGVRDIGSIFFYMWSMPLINKMLNKIEQDGNPTRIDSVNAKYTQNTISDQIKSLKDSGAITKEELTPEEFEKLVFGDADSGKIKLTDEITINKSEIIQLKDGVISLDKFNESLEKLLKEKGLNDTEIEKYRQKAQKMSELQPQIKGQSILTQEQVNRIFKGGMINDPKYLKNLYELNFGTNEKSKLGKFFDKIFNRKPQEIKANYTNPYKFISASDGKSVIKDVEFFANKIIAEAKKSNKNIDAKFLENITKKNFRLNCLNWGSGFVVSAIFLSTLIPKFQYWVTRMRTGSNEFPGTQEFRQNA